ncbi:MAG: hypothetical protein RIQ89_2263 [Bacteroidota bacterium]|jgi:tetratricopeptide (TPR) repeat protein
MKTKIKILVLLFSFFQHASIAQFEKGNDLYQKKKFEEAKVVYQQLIATEGNSFEVLYNLGNTYYKLGDYAQSILYFEKALKINKDEDVIHNLSVLNQKIKDKIEPMPQMILIKWWNSFLNYFSFVQFNVFALFCVWMLTLCFYFYRLSKEYSTKKRYFFLTLTLFIISIFSLSIAFSKYKATTHQDFAIITNDTSYIKSAPEINSADLFLLHAGTKVSIMNELVDWYQIKLSNGNIGWILKSELAII